MRICHVSPHLPPDQAANALLPAQLGTWSHTAGADVSFITQPPSQGRGTSEPLPGPVRRVVTRSGSRLQHLLRIDTLRRSRSTISALRELAADADLLHLHSNGLIIEVAAAWARRRGVPYVLTLYGTEIWHYRRRWPIDPFTKAYHGAAEVTFYSDRLMNRAHDLGLSRPGLSVVYPAVSPSFVGVDGITRDAWRTELGIAEPHVLLNVKRLHPLAGQSVLIDAFARVARGRSDVRLVICGTGPLRGDLEAQAVRLGVASRITFAGLVPNTEVARYAAIADVFVLPSLLEALPTVAVEALAAGTPVVSADHPGGQELHALFGDDVEVVPKQNADLLAEALTARLQAPRRTHADTARIVRERFSPEAVREAYDEVYQRVRGDAV
ncbi:MAG: glycosyltransferase family 4 protein [Acidobacteriota bacterium]